MKYVLALDQGTTSSRAILFDETGAVRSVAQREFRQHFPQQGWVEHDPLEIWSTQESVAREAMEQGRVRPDEIAAIGITNQRETTVLWDRSTGRPVHPAIVWQDRRTAAHCDLLRKQNLEPLFRRKTGLLLDPYFSGTKISWMLKHIPGLKKRAQKGEIAFGTIDSWLLWQLTKGRVHVTDATNASRTLLLNIKTGQWDDELLRVLDVPREILPEVRSSSEVYGETHFLGPAIPIAGIAGDQQAALFGQRCVRPGMVKNTYGTGCFMLMQLGEKFVSSKNQLLTTIALKRGRKITYALEGSVFVGGAIIQWLRDGLGIIKSSQEVEAIAGQVANTGGVYLVPALTGLGAPHWDAYARGLIIGLTRGTSRAHIVRAALESIALQSADLLQAMVEDSGIRLKELRVDGGAAVNNLLMQFQADIAGLRVIRPAITETTALGAAYLAGLAVGVWKEEKLDEYWQLEHTFEPSMKPKTRSLILGGWHEALKRSRCWENPNQKSGKKKSSK